MAESRTIAMVPLNGSNYRTWKVQCKMALMKDGLWGIVNGTETAPDATTHAELHAKFVQRRDRALGTIVLFVDSSLLYLLGEPEDPVKAWTTLSEQFDRKTWANKLELRRKLFSLRLKEGGSVQEHIKHMTEIFDGLSAIDAPLTEEDRVVYLLASLPESYDVLVTALEANVEVPKMAVVVERLLHTERKLNEKRHTVKDERAMAAKTFKKKGKCHQCGKYGHYKRDCYDLVGKQKESKKYKKHKVSITLGETDDSDSDGEALVTGGSARSSDCWIIDSGATSHMSNNKELFVEYRELSTPEKVTLGDGRCLDVVGKGTVELKMVLPDNKKTKRHKLMNTLYVPKLSINLFSIAKVSKAGKVASFDEQGCYIRNQENKLIAFAKRVRSLYYFPSKLTIYSMLLF